MTIKKLAFPRVKTLFFFLKKIFRKKLFQGSGRPLMTFETNPVEKKFGWSS